MHHDKFTLWEPINHSTPEFYQLAVHCPDMRSILRLGSDTDGITILIDGVPRGVVWLFSSEGEAPRQSPVTQLSGCLSVWAPVQRLS